MEAKYQEKLKTQELCWEQKIAEIQRSSMKLYDELKQVNNTNIEKLEKKNKNNLASLEKEHK